MYARQGRPSIPPEQLLRTLLLHVTVKQKGSQIDGLTPRHPGYEISQRKRKRIEECFGGIKTIGLLGKLHHRGKARVNWIFRFTAAAYNITLMKVLMV